MFCWCFILFDCNEVFRMFHLVLFLIFRIEKVLMKEVKVFGKTN